MNKPYKAVIFDLDGTLIDSMWVWERVDEVFLKRYGIVPPKDMDSVLEGKSFTETAIYFKERFNLPDTVEEIKKMWNHIAWDFYTKEVQLKKDAKYFIQFLKERDIKLGIATSNSTELVKAVLEHLEIVQYFDAVRTSCEVEKGKPHPYVYLKVAEDLNIDPEYCLVLEDVPNGVKAGKNAGMDVWAVDDGQPERIKEELIKIADNMIDHYEQAVVLWKQIQL